MIDPWLIGKLLFVMEMAKKGYSLRLRNGIFVEYRLPKIDSIWTTLL